MFSSSQVGLITLGLLAVLAPTLANNQTSSCRCIPGDACWPDQPTWSELNNTVHGRLIATTPLASVCHEPTYDEAACSQLAEVWNLPQTQYV